MEQLVLDMNMETIESCHDEKPNAVPVELLPLNDYDIVILNLSGGDDSMDCLFWLKKAGLDFKKLELWHQLVDGHGEDYHEFWDWPVTEAYCEAVAS
jgi:hypothetical protein